MIIKLTPGVNNITVSDGEHSVNWILPSSYDYHVRNKKLQEGDVIQVRMVSRDDNNVLKLVISIDDTITIKQIENVHLGFAHMDRTFQSSIGPSAPFCGSKSAQASVQFPT